MSQKYRFWAGPAKDGGALTNTTTRLSSLITNALEGVAEGIYGSSRSSYNSLRHTVKLTMRGGVAAACLGQSVHDAITRDVVPAAQNLYLRGHSVTCSLYTVFALTAALLAAVVVTTIYMTAVITYGMGVVILECALSMLAQVSTATLGAMHNLQRLSSTVYKEEISGIRSHTASSLPLEQRVSDRTVEGTAPTTKDNMFGKQAARFPPRASVPAAVFAAVIRMIIPIVVAALAIPLVPLVATVYAFIAGYDLYIERRELARARGGSKRARLDADAAALGPNNDGHYEHIDVGDDTHQNFEEQPMYLRTSPNYNKESNTSSTNSSTSSEQGKAETKSLKSYFSVTPSLRKLMEFRTSAKSASISSLSESSDSGHVKNAAKIINSGGLTNNTFAKARQRGKRVPPPRPPLPKTPSSSSPSGDSIELQMMNTDASMSSGTSSTKATPRAISAKKIVELGAQAQRGIVENQGSVTASVSSLESTKPQRPAPKVPAGNTTPSPAQDIAATQVRPSRPPIPKGSSVIEAAKAAGRVSSSASKGHDSSSVASLFSDARKSILGISSRMWNFESTQAAKSVDTSGKDPVSVSAKTSAVRKNAPVTQVTEGVPVASAVAAAGRKATGSSKPPRPAARVRAAEVSGERAVYENTAVVQKANAEDSSRDVSAAASSSFLLRSSAVTQDSGVVESKPIKAYAAHVSQVTAGPIVASAKQLFEKGATPPAVDTAAEIKPAAPIHHAQAAAAHADSADQKRGKSAVETRRQFIQQDAEQEAQTPMKPNRHAPKPPAHAPSSTQASQPQSVVATPTVAEIGATEAHKGRSI